MPRKYPESEDDFLRMQQEAIRRVREMQSRARATLEQAGVHIENNGDMPSNPPAQSYANPAPQPRRPAETVRREPPKEEAKVPPKRETVKIPTPAPVNSKNKSVFNLSLDTDQIMIMILIYILIQDGADQWLILSLAYVLMS